MSFVLTSMIYSLIYSETAEDPIPNFRSNSNVELDTFFYRDLDLTTEG